MDFGSAAHEHQLKLYIISLLVQGAQADHDFSTIEKKYLSYAAKSLGITESEVAAIRLNPSAFEMAPPQSEQERMNLLYYLLFMMRADQAVKTEEEAICHHLGFKLGFRRELISDLVNVMKDCLGKEIPPDAMMERVRAYLN